MNYKILVNKVYPYNKEMFNNVILKKIINDIGEEYLLEKRTLKAYLDLKKDLEKDNIKIVINSGYRSIEDQIDTKNKYLSTYGLDYTNKYVAEPGSSEHHTGLCFDIGIMIDNKVVDEYDDLKPYMDMFETIMTKLKDYGLILRYPKGKEKITGYNYEPWHYRYVGKSTANIITDNNLTLEEYNELYNKSGVLLVNKPKGLTSRDVVNRLEKVFDTKKVGHNGTLDPMAEGLLVITINKATKINELLTCTLKEYIAEVKVGVETDTLDLEGEVVKTSKKRVSKDMLEDLFNNFPREYLQEVPKYSAIKVDGKKLYEYARSNKDIELPKRKVIIKELELLDYKEDYFKFRCVVSKGTYIRSLIKDMGDYLDIPCTMSGLLRTRQGKFKLSDAVNLDDVSINSSLITISNALDIDKREIKDKDYKKIINGASINNSYNTLDKVIFFKNNKEIAIYQNIDNKLKCFKMLNETN